MSQIPRFNIQGAPPHEYTIGVVCDPNDAHRHGAVIGSFGSAFAATRTFTPGIFGGDPYAFRQGFVGAEMAGARHPEPQPNYAGMVAVESVPYQPTPEQLRDREEHKKAFYALYSENYRDIEHKKTKLIRKSVHSEASRVLKILKSGRHPSEADVDSDTAAAMRQASGAAGGSAVQDEAERDPTVQPAKRARKMPRRFYHYTRVYMLHNYSGKLALAYRPDSTAAEGGGEAGDERAGKPPRMVTNFEDVFEAMADVHYKKDFHVKVGVTEKILRDVYYNIPRNCIKAFVQTCKCQQARPKRETEEERQRRKSPISGETAAAGSSAGLKGQEGRASLSGSHGAVVWLTGRSGVGKSTIAALLETRLLGKAVLSLQLDPKVVCHGLCSDLGFTRLARAETLRRVTEVAKHVADAGLIAIASFVSPLRAERAAAREAFRPAQNRFFEVYVAAAKATLLARGGVDDSVPKDGRMEDAYEEPAAPELMLDTDQCSAEDCVRQIIRMLEDAGLLVRGAAARFQAPASPQAAAGPSNASQLEEVDDDDIEEEDDIVVAAEGSEPPKHGKASGDADELPQAAAAEPKPAQAPQAEGDPVAGGGKAAGKRHRPVSTESSRSGSPASSASQVSDSEAQAGARSVPRSFALSLNRIVLTDFSPIVQYASRLVHATQDEECFE